MRSYLGGILLGLVVAVVGLGAISVLTGSDLPDAPPPEAATDAPEGPASVDGDTAPEAEPADDGVTPGASPEAPDPVEAESLPESEPAAMPEAAEDGVDSPVPGGTDSAPEVPAGGDATPEGGVSPDMPGGDAGAETPPDPAPAAQIETGDVPGVPAVPEVGEDGPDMATLDTPEVPGAPAAPGSAPGDEAAPEAGVPPAPLPEAEDADEDGTLPVVTPGVGSGSVGSLTDRNPAPTRLPTIGGDEGQEEAGTGPTVEMSNALVANAKAFRPLGDRAAVSILLIDSAEARADFGALDDLPFAVSFVVDAAAEDAEEAIAFYRARGEEVVLSVPLPEGATPTDIETVMQVYRPLLEQSVAVLMPPSSGFQTLGAGAVQVGVILSEYGLGLVSMPQGLNTGHKSAIKEGVPAGLVFRELDNDGQSGAVIRRFVDNAAFRAAQEGGVILLAHARPETVQALVEWSLGNRAQTVTLAPVSALLQQLAATPG